MIEDVKYAVMASAPVSVLIMVLVAVFSLVLGDNWISAAQNAWDSSVFSLVVFVGFLVGFSSGRIAKPDTERS